MNRVKLFYCAGIMGLALFLVMMVVGGLGDVGAATAVASTSLHRPQDPVIVRGEDLAPFNGAAINELQLYTFVTNNWQPIPFQIDEVNASGVYTTFEDGLLDANDELVFMGRDAGEVALANDWVDDAESRTHPRVVMTATDPLEPGAAGLAYLYRSTTLMGNLSRYVAWDETSQTVTAVSYTLSFDPAFLGISDLAINGNPIDILDRQKIRAAIQFLGTFNEETIPAILNIPTNISLPITGPVRAVGGNESAQFAFYGEQAATTAAFDLSVSPFTVNSIRTSLDLKNPATTNMSPTVYYDSNTPAGVLVDGAPDGIAPSPRYDWYEVSGAPGGFVAVGTADAGSGTLTNYYLDDDSVNGNDTGDQLSFADAGVLMSSPGDVVSVTQAFYITLPGAGSVGSTVETWFNNPLQVATAVQLLSSGQTADIFLPFIKR